MEEYAQSYLAGHTVASTQGRGAPGRARPVVGVRLGRRGDALPPAAARARAAGWSASTRRATPRRPRSTRRTLDEMWSSLTIERPDRYPVTEWKDQQASLGIPESWRETRRFSGGGTLLVQYVSPPLAVDKGRETVHASLSVTFEAVPDGGGLARVLRGDPPQARRQLPGDEPRRPSRAATWTSCAPRRRWRSTFVKRFYFAQGGRGCSLSFEAREDVFPRASRWADFIASTLRSRAARGRRRSERHPRPPGRRPRPPPAAAPTALEVEVGPGGPAGATSRCPPAATARGRRPWSRAARACARPSPRTTSTSSCPRRSGGGPAAGLWVEVEYFGARYGEFRVQYASTRPRRAVGRPLQGRRAALAAGGGGAAALPPRALPPARLRPRRARRTWAPPSASSSAARSSSRACVAHLAPPARPRRLPRRGAAARAAQDAGPLLPDQLPLRRDHERVQLQVHVVPGRDHGPPARLHEEGAGLPHPRRDRGEEGVARARSTR